MGGVNPPRTRVWMVADDREEAGGVLAELRAREDAALEGRRRPAGDSLVGERFGVERKTLRDFAQSVIDARLFKQAATASAAELAALEGLGETTAARIRWAFD
jgi:ERCC4-type nuclease